MSNYCRRKVDIACIQEPIADQEQYDKLMSLLATSSSIFHSKDSMAAIIIFNRNLFVAKVSQETLGWSHGRSPIKSKMFLRH